MKSALELLKNEVLLKDDTLITSKTDLKGNITYGNLDFTHYGAYSEKEFLDKPHSIVRHPFMPRAAFKLLWDTIEAKQEFFAFTCNLSKKRQTYWVFVNVTPSYNENGEVIGYYSVRRRPSKAGVETTMEIYKQLLLIEKEKGLNASVQFVLDYLEQNKISWNEFIIGLQKQAEVGGYR
ncbi:PAS domain-containing protein [Helicobacter turcicus]|uniref:PAS domain-containing protein n=1 Tax=Helicobacter turcicus TaxID=2867412 RepID=A0ABS7JKQ8_9HELI|nr:PAS domain-containing protein [Helicobacter turcicus]MBX7489978.1 PAS domain-containing protein [Helicobacter turcicus]MBX7544837.1 PAS domain-containing protein [Helicobacter turcicus]